MKKIMAFALLAVMATGVHAQDKKENKKDY